ncbi:Putative polysaccharide biosynthesis protein with aminopeptidase-like domain protein [Pontiella desulfatans]|uniref:Polysaccharide biosynthesis protein with aminopeptidase-like domain protein n=2 Tax=Pontiella desulfatans TaxID=2750659 RepID=A0A6C2U4L4_PONDE|nr:Putative polysaccharide biosynthesis protein with aminopeptidase-like domain protein [Pontiella desulfatans]
MVDMFGLVERLYPICRSITGDGVRETLRVVGEHIPLDLHEVPTGSPAFDWKVPDEWNIRDGWIKNPAGEKIVDFQQLNLHVLNYSEPVHKTVSLEELKQHVFTLPEQPGWVPYRTSYHNRNWGFCMAHRQFEALGEGDYEVFIDSSLEPGSLTYGELLVPGASEKEVLFVTHVCHPSLCNDNLSGIAVATALAQKLAAMETNQSYRFLFLPATIGAITWLSRNQDKLDRIKHGLVLCLLGDNGKFHYKKSRDGNAGIDRIVPRVLKQSVNDFETMEFYPYGYDERQFCSPAFDLPVGRLSRAVHGEFPEYHSSADNLDFVSEVAMQESLDVLQQVVESIEGAETYINLKPECEPQLGRRGLFKPIGGQAETKDYQMALLWILSLSDGHHSLEDIAEQSGLSLDILRKAVDELLKTDLLALASA